jgi:formylglycine-generating enzyme required for sulfatase activity
MPDLPLIVLAFANEQEGHRYLRNLPEERRGLEKILEEAERNNLCRVKSLPNATLPEIFDIFTRNPEQVVVFHYAGHADSGQLLLESSSIASAPAHAGGLAKYLGQCGGLQLVFLNGCSTRAQIPRLLEAGVAAVIATARAIDDTMAREFAMAFYTELGSGEQLRAAYELARSRLLAARGDVPESYYAKREIGPIPDTASPDPADESGFPWEFRPRLGDELVEHWNLPEAAGNPEFGLPQLPKGDLPECPFRNLAWFTAKDAEIFFGRGYQVRELYEQLTDATGPPILLVYGASGVGKSSLLDAGLVPRLEARGDIVRYCRRDQERGLSKSLRDALNVKAEPMTLGEAWRAEEARLGAENAVFVLLDQVEEVFTRPNPAQPQELDEFLAALAGTLGSRDARPRGKLVLGFRKEWLAEIDRRLAEAKLPRGRMFVKQLDRRGIIDAICGPAKPGRLQRQYLLSIEDGLAEVIAEDLLADAGSALTPTLQVFLTKMWERARQINADQPRFDRALYEALKSEGYLLKDVLEEGFKAIGRWNPAIEQSGLALDLLAYHATELGTAAQRTRAELEVRYAHKAAALDGLVGCFKDRYLLLEAEPQPSATIRTTRLAHDLLAPLVQQKFRLSVAPGQRARRLLENRATDWADGRTGPVLDSADLATVEQGASGMRARTPDEARLVEASHEAERRLRRQRLRFGVSVLAGALAVVAPAVVLAVQEYRKAAAASTGRAQAQVEDLLVANPQAVPAILKGIWASREAMDILRARKVDPALSRRQRVRIGIAAVPSDPSESKPLLESVLKPESDPGELLLVSDALKPHAALATDTLWRTVQDPKSRPDLLLPYSAALAALAPDDKAWKAVGNRVGPAMLDANPLHLGIWTEAFRPVKEHIIEPLIDAYHGKDPNNREAAATILADYASDRLDLLIDLLKDGDAQQYRVLWEKLQIMGSAERLKNGMNEEIRTEDRPDAGYADRERLASRKANAIITLTRLGEPSHLWQRLRHAVDPRARTHLIQRIASFGVPVTLLAERLSQENDAGARWAVVLALGTYPTPAVTDQLRRQLARRLLAEYERDPDPGIHSAVFWLLRNWGYLAELGEADRRLAGKPCEKRAWFVNRQGQTFVTVKKPDGFSMGSPLEEAEFGRNNVERLHQRLIPRTFAVCTREVSVADFLAFLNDPSVKGLDYRLDDQRQFSPALDGPIVSVTWFEAAKYCRWLSEQEKISRDEMCYPPIADIRENMQLPENYLTRTGYRLPTEAEWEFCCRAGTGTPWVFGSDASLLSKYARYINNSMAKSTQRAGSAGYFMPNSLGLFDTHGNVNEWCFDRNPPYPESGATAVDREQDDLVVRDADRRIYRGGSFADLPPMTRSAYRDGARPSNQFPAVGFRVARTMPPR